MLIICRSFLKNELQPVEKYFSKKHLIDAAHKAKNGLGKTIGGMGVSEGEIRKIYITGKTSAGRVIFLINTNDGLFIPVLLRPKSDIIGCNMSSKNTEFVRVFQKSLTNIRADLENENFKIEKL